MDVNVESSTYGKTMPNLLAYLQHYFSPKITYYEGNGVGLRKDLKKPSVKGCWTDGSIDAETLGKFQLGHFPISGRRVRFDAAADGRRHRGARGIITNTSR